MAARSANHLYFGDALRSRREELGLTQEQAGAPVGIDRSYWGALERGERNFSFDQLPRLETALQTRASELFRRAERLRARERRG